MISARSSKLRIPSLRRHKASGLGVVTIRGSDLYCGKFGTPECDRNYQRVIADYLANGPELVRQRGVALEGGFGRRFTPPSTRGVTVAELLLAYVEHAEREYLPPSREVEIVKNSIRTVREMFGEIMADQFGPRYLKAVRQKWISDGHARKYINARIGRIKRIWQWGTQEELVNASTWHALLSVKGLAQGRGSAKESEPRKDVPEADYNATMKGVTPEVRAICDLMVLTAARPEELRTLRTRDIIRDSLPWECPLQHHKMAHKGHKRVLFFGPKARAILAPFLNDDAPDEYLFSPLRAARAVQDAAKVDHRSDTRRAMAAANKRKLEGKKRAAATGKSRPKSSRRPGAYYSRHALANAVRRANIKLGVPHWTPYCLRHTAKTRLEEKVGKAAMAAVTGEPFASKETSGTLGHAHQRMTSKYGDTCFGLAAVTMEQYG